MGRPTRLTPEIAEAIEKQVRLGAPVSVAAEALGLDGAMACEWVARGEGRDKRPKRKVYVQFAQRIKKAASEDVLRRIRRIDQAGEGGQVVARETITKPTGETIIREKWSEPQWTADMTHLERRYPQEWGRRMEHSSPGGGPLPSAIQVYQIFLPENARLGTAALSGPNGPVLSLPPHDNGDS